MYRFYQNLDGIAKNMSHEIMLEEFEMKEETVSFKEEILPGSTTVEDTCTVYVQGERIKRESTDNQSKKNI